MNSQHFATHDSEARPMPTLCLTPDQIADLLIADDPNSLSFASRKRHLAVCNTCSNEFARLELAVSGFRESARSGSAAVYEAIAPAMRTQRSHHYAAQPIVPIRTHRAAWAMAAAAIIMLVTIPFAPHRGEPDGAAASKGTTTSLPATGAPMTDEALMDGINEDLSVSVPTSLQPLADPATSDSGSSVSNDTTTVR